jgi:hypothetical protein
VLAGMEARGLTKVGASGKNVAAPRSKQGMTTHQTRTTGPCRSPGPPVDVVAWRACRLREAGFPPVLADALATQRVDLHALLQLVDAGCPPDLAARIMAPVNDSKALW